MRRIPPANGLGLLIIGMAALPLIIKNAKPLAKRIGQEMEDWGRKLRESVEKMEAECQAKTEASPSSTVAEEPAQEKPKPKTTQAKRKPSAGKTGTTRKRQTPKPSDPDTLG